MTASLVKELIIPSPYHGQRIDVALAQLFSEFSRAQLSTWLKQGLISVNGVQYKPKDKVATGDKIVLLIPETVHDETIAAEEIPLDIVFEDDYLLIVNKPAGLVVHPGAGNPNHTLVNALLHHSQALQQLPRAGIVHRLDKDTTGLLIVAKTLPSYTTTIRQMQAREIQRHYLTLVYGHVISGGMIDTYFGRHPHNRLKMAVCAQGRQAITQYTLQKQYQYFTLLNVKLMTGRTHQIRVHMAHMNHPVVGDALYGGRVRIPVGASESLKRALQQFKRQALHAYSLSFAHPHTGESLHFTAPLPDDFQSLLTIMDDHFD
jgi:23S rRNA pseudouridine1911/1915/1917 synthase